jgi:hypothetical protein
MFEYRIGTMMLLPTASEGKIWYILAIFSRMKNIPKMELMQYKQKLIYQIFPMNFWKLQKCVICFSRFCLNSTQLT